MNTPVHRPLWRGATINLVRGIAAILLSAVLSSSLLNAQDTAPNTGTVSGRVLNADSGRYVGAATVAVEGTDVQTKTNDFGEFTLRGLPEGEAVLRVTYVGQLPVTQSVVVRPGEVVSSDIRLGRTSAEGAVVLDEFTVDANRFKTAMEIAINEERSSINIKNVVSADAFGDIPSSNVGEFVKFLPGVQIDYGSFNGNNQGYNDDDASGISIRGFGPEDTALLVDGLPVASATPGNLSRQVALDQLAINNASRVEIIKVATPDMPANSLGGQVNLVTKSAFEYARPQYTGRVFFNVNSENADLKKTPGPVDGESYKITPGAEFTITKPISKTLGVSFTGFGSREANGSSRGQVQWNNNHAANYRNGAFTNAAGQASSMENPILTRYQVTDSGSMTDRYSGNFRVDWKPTNNQLLRANVQYSAYESIEAQRRLDFRPAIGAGTDWGPDYVVGRNANSNGQMTVTTRDREGETKSAQLQYMLQIGGWRIDAAGSYSRSESDFRDAENGHFSEVALNLNPGKMELRDIKNGRPQTVATYWRANAGTLAGTVKDFTQLSNWAFDGTNAKSGAGNNIATKALYKVDVERALDFTPFLRNNPMAFKAGFRYDEEKDEKSGVGSGYREILRPDESYAVSDVLDEDYQGISPGFGLPGQQWASSYTLYEIEQERDIFYVPDGDEETNTRVENYTSWVNQQKSIKESTDAWYAMLTGRFLKNRLSFVGGLRQETKERKGRGPFTDNRWDYIKRDDGSLWVSDEYRNGVQFSAGNNRPLFADTPAGEALRAQLTSEGIEFPTEPYGPVRGANQSLASKMLQLIPNRPVNQKAKGDPSYSANSAFEITKDLIVKVAYSRSFGLPDLENQGSGILSGNGIFTFEEYTADQQEDNQGTLGQIRVANPGLLPETSDNWDFELAYYTQTGGKLGVSWYHKTVTNQSMDITTYSGSAQFDAVINAIGLDPADFNDWRVVTSTNSNTKQKTSGFEFEVRQSLEPLGGWGRHFQVFATYSMTDLADPAEPVPYEITTPDGGTLTLTPETATVTRRADRFGSAGIQFATRKFMAQLRGTYRNENELGSERVELPDGNFIRRYQPAESRVDLSMTYALSDRFSLFLSGRDIFNGRRKQVIRDDFGKIPEYAQLFDLREFGVDWTFGVNARF